MYCNLCHMEKEKGIELLGARVCYDCFDEISTISVLSDNYEYYKERVKKIVKNYIYEKTILNPVK
ncbi:MAG: inhibitor of sigma-G Gin [Tissierellia bacterium]|nr:inhibitor of sigma-G Gin [Tissierellia bacterium]